MVEHTNRRAFLRSAAGAAAGVALCTAGAWPLQARSRDRVQPVRLGGDSALFTGAGGNVVAVRGNAGVLLIDGGVADRADALLAAVSDEMATDRVTALFNTHWHREHTGCNLRVGEAGTPIVAHERTRLWLGTTVTWPWDGRRFEPLPDTARPTQTFHSTLEQDVDGRPVRCGYLLQAHTDGDMYVFVPDENVLVTGGAVVSDGWPFIDWWTGGWIGGMVDGLDSLLTVADADTRIVPASGPVMTRDELEAQRDMYATIYTRLREMLLDGRSPAEAVAARPTREYGERWGDPARFVTMAFQSQWAHTVPNA